MLNSVRRVSSWDFQGDARIYTVRGHTHTHTHTHTISDQRKGKQTAFNATKNRYDRHIRKNNNLELGRGGGEGCSMSNFKFCQHWVSNI